MNFDEMIASMRKESLLKHDKLIFYIILAHLPITMFLIPIGYDTMGFAVVASLLVGGATAAAYYLVRGTRLFGILAGVILMMISAIMIQTQLGRIEMHFHIFSAIALMLLYRDWATVVAAAGTIAVHHLLMTGLQLGGVHIGDMPLMVYNYDCSWGIAFLHAAFVVFEAAILIYFTIIMRREEMTGLQLIAAVTEVDREHNLAIRIPGGDNDDVAAAFNNMLGNFQSLVGNLKVTSSSLASASRQMIGNTQQVSDNISIQHEQIEHAVTAMTEMSKTIHDVALNSQQASASASEADNEASKGAQLVNDAVSKTRELLESMNTASDAMNQLESNVGNIGTVVDVIRGISEQTNLLALNAAIEAARAGEQGRGFAVVADEVRTLAQRTQESTEEIQDIIESLQSVTGKAVSSINTGQEQTDKTSEEIIEAGGALDTIVGAVSSISSMNIQIATAAEQQAAVADSISENISNISDSSTQSVEKVTSNQAFAQQFQSMSEELDKQINVYRVE